MLKMIASTALASVVLSSCAGMSYEARCAAPLEKTATAKDLASSNKLIRENYVYTERIYYSANEWVLFADVSGRDMSRLNGPAHIVKGTGNIAKSAVLPMTSIEIFEGEWDISQSNPKCYSITNDGEMAKGFLATTNQYPFTMKDEAESLWKVDYFDLYHPSRLQNDGELKLTHANPNLNLTIAANGSDFTVNGLAAKMVPSNKPFANAMLEVAETDESYLIIGTRRLGSSGLYYVLKNNAELLIMKGPNR